MCVPAVVLETSLGSQYEDSPSSYEFPANYLRQFPTSWVEPVYAVLYDPRGDDGRGRMKYVAWAQIAGPPVPSGRISTSGRPLFIVHYVSPAETFGPAVPREVLGLPVERLAGGTRAWTAEKRCDVRARRTWID